MMKRWKKGKKKKRRKAGRKKEQKRKEAAAKFVNLELRPCAPSAAVCQLHAPARQQVGKIALVQLYVLHTQYGADAAAPLLDALLRIACGRRNPLFIETA